MARSWHYPRWRRYVMQVTLWLILGATVGLAALVNHERRRSMRVELGSPSSHGWLTVRLPKTWQQSTIPDRDGRIIARAVEPDEHGLGRTITITRDRVTDPISPLEFLLSSSNQILGLDLFLAQHARGGAKELVEPITVGGYPGVLVRGVRAAGRNAGAGAAGALPHKEIYGATVVPSGHAIVVKLEGDRPAELSDVEIVKQLASAIEVIGQPGLGQAGETVALEGGIRFAAPEGFKPVYENDANLLRRRLWPDGDATRWAAAELIPCLLAPTENNDEAMAIKALAAVHDPALRDAVVTPDGPRRWRIARSGTPGPFAPRGYLLADELGDAGAITGGPRRALLAFFYTGSGDADAAVADGAWDVLARSVSFVGKTQFGGMLDAGRTEVERIRMESLPQLLGTTGEQWWVWFDEAERRNVGWTQVAWRLNRRNDAASPEKSEGKAETIFRTSGGRKSGVESNWVGELRSYTAYTAFHEPEAGEPVSRIVKLDDGKLLIDLSSNGRTLAQGSGAVPSNFLSGAWLPLLVGRLSDQPMMLRSDAFLSREPIGAPVPTMLIVEPVTEQPTPTDRDGTPLRCVSVRVNGSSEASRWYVRPNGHVHRVTFARGLQRMPSDEQTVRFTFGPDVNRFEFLQDKGERNVPSR